MWGLLDINNVMLQIGDYPLSYLEFFGTVLYFLSVWLIARKNIWTWAVGIVSVMLYAILFYQIQLYADMLEQAYYLTISVIGWLTWHQQKSQNLAIATQWSKMPSIVGFVGLTAILSSVLAYCTANFHLWLPKIFPEPASYPVLDATTTVMSFVAMYLTTIRRNEGWLYWIIVDIIAIGLYWVKGVKFISIQYVFLLGMAMYGLWHWQKNKNLGLINE